MERCPICRASLSEPPICRRCKSDLTRPLAIAEEAHLLLRHAMHKLANGDVPAAEALAIRSQCLRSSDLARALVGFCHSKTA